MEQLLFLGNLGTGEIIIIAIIVLLLFGGKKIPELMKGIGKGVKNFKDGVKGIEDDIKVEDWRSLFLRLAVLLLCAVATVCLTASCWLPAILILSFTDGCVI